MFHTRTLRRPTERAMAVSVYTSDTGPESGAVIAIEWPLGYSHERTSGHVLNRSESVALLQYTASHIIAIREQCLANLRESGGRGCLRELVPELVQSPHQNPGIAHLR